jgi:hypothetical protein
VEQNRGRDTASIPPATDDRPGVLKVIIRRSSAASSLTVKPSTNEDKGMMGVVVVVV